MTTEPEKAFIMGGTWRTPVISGLQDKNFVKDLKNDATFNEAAFDMEYRQELYSLNYGELREGFKMLIRSRAYN